VSVWFSSSPIGKSEAQRSEFALLYEHWLRYCSPRAATALARAGCKSLEEVAAIGRIPLGRLPNTGKVTLDVIASLLAASGLAFIDDAVTPLAALARTLALTIPDQVEAEEVARDCLSSLRRAGFVLTTRK
jgi:hypothetical protein